MIDMVTQKMIAEKAGVSFATVSRAITHSAKVRPEMMQRIRAAMNELGVSSSDDLFLGKSALSKMVLVIVGDIAVEFFANVVIGVCDELKRMGYTVTLCNSAYKESDEISAIRKAEADGYAGIIMVTVVETEQMISALTEVRIPVVLVNRYIRSLDLDVVRIDNYRGGYLAGQCLIDNGHRRIAHLSGPKNSSAPADRLRGFMAAMQDNGCPFSQEDVIFGDLSLDCGRDFASLIAGKGYTAIYVGNDYMAAGAVARFEKLGISVPKDISILCFDDSPLISEDSLNITCVSSDPRRMGHSAAEVLLKRIAEPLGEHIKIIYSPKLILRGSIQNIK